MHLLSETMLLPVTWALCAVFLGLALRDLMRRWRGHAEDLVREAEWFRHRGMPSASERWHQFFGILYERNEQRTDEALLQYSLGRAALWAFLAAPLALIAARAATDDRVLGVFGVFRDDPGAAERAGRCLLVLLCLATAVRLAPEIRAWTLRSGDGWPGGRVRQLLWAVPFLPLHLLGLTMPMILLLGVMLLVAIVMSLPETQRNADPEVSPLVHAGLQTAAVLALLAILVPLHLIVTPHSGFVAALLVPGLLLPLAVAPALFVTLHGAGRLVVGVVHHGWGRLGFVGIVLRALGIALAGLALLAAGLTAALWLASVLAPAGYRPDLSALWAGLGTDPGLGPLVAILAGVTVLPLLAILVEGLAREIALQSPQHRRARALVAAGAPRGRIASAAMRARLLGWTGGAVLAGLPLLALAVALAGR